MSPNEPIITNIGKVYAGRASSSPIVDLFITLLSMGLSGYKGLLQQRQNMLEHFQKRLSEVAEKYGEKTMQCPANTISFGVTLDHLVAPKSDPDQSEGDYLQAISKDVSYFGAMLFQRCVSGTRVVPRGQSKNMSGEEFIGFGSSHHAYPYAYMTAACAIGLTKEEADEFFTRLDKTLKEFKTKQRKKEAKKAAE